MNALLEIEQAVSQLPQNDLAAFRKWFQQFDASAWDAQFENDVMARKLDALAEDAKTQ
jgi:hypothetical protein